MPDYDIQGLAHGIEQARKHIEVLEQAIQKEHDTISNYKVMINELERKKEIAENTKKD